MRLTPMDDPVPLPRPVLSVRDLDVTFALERGPFQAVRGVSFDLWPGRTLCIVGESGSGKSVTARAILQIVGEPGRVSGGQILYRDAAGHETDLAALDPFGRDIRAFRGGDIAMIFQEPMTSLSPVHTIGDQITEVLHLHTDLSRKEARARAIEMLARVEIPEPERAFERYTFEYSGGMRQRVMIAMALAANPRILIADEPTTALDVTTQAEILDLIAKLQADFHMAVVFITHDMGVVAEIADEVLVMHHGRVAERGDVQTIFHAPREDYTRMLIASVLRLESPAEGRRRNATGEPLLQVRGLTKTFGITKSFGGKAKGGVHALRDVSLTLAQGETLGVVGESGSGKTTLGRCILRAVEPTSGSVRLLARDGTALEITTLHHRAMAQAYRDMRMVFQDPYGSLNPRMSVGQIIAEPMVVNGMVPPEGRDARVAELLTMVGMPPEAAERYPHAFSGGQRQRISIARAISLNPRLIIADEATSALDVSLRATILDLLIDLQNRLELSFLFISHDISVIRYFCDRVAVMYRGRIVEEGPTLRVCDTPDHPYTRALLSAVPRPDPNHRRLAQRTRYHQDAQ